MEPTAFDLRDHVWFDADEPQLREITASPALRLNLLCLEPKQSMPATLLDNDRLYTVIGGRVWAVLDDAEVVLEPLQAVLVPAGTAHGLRNDSADPLILQVVDVPVGDAAAAVHPPVHHPKPDRPKTDQPKTDRFHRLRKLLGSGD